MFKAQELYLNKDKKIHSMTISNNKQGLKLKVIYKDQVISL
jgi:hypothetical protein